MKKYLLILSLIASFATARAQMWKDVGSPALSTGIINYISEVTDSNGLPYVAYMDVAYGQALTVQHFDGVHWNIVGDPGFSPYKAFDNQIALGPTGIPYVAFLNVIGTSAAGTSVMKFDGTSWVPVGPKISGYTNNPSITISADGTPYITCAEDFTNYVKTFRFDGTSWVQVGPSFSPPVSFEYPRIKMGKSDTPFVAMASIAGSGGGPVTVIKYDGISWHTVDSAGIGPGNSRYWASFAIDSFGIPYVAFDDTDNGVKATVKKYTGGRWTPVGAIGFSAGESKTSDLVISKKQQPYVSFSDWFNGGKTTAMTYNGSNWVTIGNAGFSDSMTGWTCIGIDTTDIPYVFYSELLTGKGYVRRPELSPITGNDSVCKGTDITQSHSVSGGTWTSSNNTKATVDPTGKVSGIDTGIVSITYTVLSMPPAIHTIKIKDCRLIVPSIDDFSVTIFPNPANDGLNVTGVTNTVNYRLLNLTGITLYIGTLLPGNNTLNLRDLSAGVYLLEMTDRDKGRKIMRVIKD